MRKIIFLAGLVWALLAGAGGPAWADEIAVIETKFGNIEIEFFPNKAPGHVKNFKSLAKSGFYNGTLFHRVIPGFMIQGGDPNSKQADRDMHGSGGPGYTIKAEFNDTPHARGIVSMARAGHPDSAGSQFFIVVKDAGFLDGQYTAFGKVTQGIEVVDKIVEQIIAENRKAGVPDEIILRGCEQIFPPRCPQKMSHTNPLGKIEMKITVKSKK